MKHLYVILIAVALFSCKGKKDDPQPTSRFKNPAMSVDLSGSGIGKSVTINFILKDTLETQIIKSWSKTVTYSTNPTKVILDLPGLPESGKYYQLTEVCYSGNCYIPVFGEFTGDLLIITPGPPNDLVCTNDIDIP